MSENNVWSFEQPPLPQTQTQQVNMNDNIQQYLLTNKPTLIILTPCYNSSLYAGYT
jgi:hypothetical protein